MDIARTLNSIGKESFINFYNEYKAYYLSDNKSLDKEILAQKLLVQNVRAYKIGGQYTRINSALRIFEAGVESDALKIVLSAKVPNKVKNQAKKILLEIN